MRAKRARFTFRVDKSSLKMPKNGQFGEFGKTVACGQTMLPDQSLFDKKCWRRQKLKKSQMRHFILSYFWREKSNISLNSKTFLLTFKYCVKNRYQPNNNIRMKPHVNCQESKKFSDRCIPKYKCLEK